MVSAFQPRNRHNRVDKYGSEPSDVDCESNLVLSASDLRSLAHRSYHSTRVITSNRFDSKKEEGGWYESEKIGNDLGQARI